MCLDLTYRNSRSEFLVDFSYLAIVNKVREDENIVNGINYGGFFDNYLWMKLEDASGRTILTALWNEEMWGDLYSNVLDMFIDSTYTTTYIGELIDKTLSSPGRFYVSSC